MKNAGYFGSRKYGDIDMLLKIENLRKEKHYHSDEDTLLDKAIRNLKNWLEYQDNEASLPFACLDHSDIDEFCRWLSANSPGQYILPTELDSHKFLLP